MDEHLGTAKYLVVFLGPSGLQNILSPVGLQGQELLPGAHGATPGGHQAVGAQKMETMLGHGGGTIWGRGGAWVTMRDPLTVGREGYLAHLGGVMAGGPMAKKDPTGSGTLPPEGDIPHSEVPAYP